MGVKLERLFGTFRKVFLVTSSLQTGTHIICECKKTFQVVRKPKCLKGHFSDLPLFCELFAKNESVTAFTLTLLPFH